MIHAFDSWVCYQESKRLFPDRAYATLRYTARRDLVAHNTTLNAITYRANTCYDPNPAVIGGGEEGAGSALGLNAGHQPRGFDQYMQIYGRCRVTKARVTVKCLFENYAGPTIQNRGAAGIVQATESDGKSQVPSSCPVVLTLTKDVDGWNARTASEQMEMPGTQWKFLTPNALEPATMRMTVDMKDMFGPGYVELDKISHSAVTNPEQMAFIHFAAARCNDDSTGFDGVARNINLVAYFKIDYDCIFDNKIEYSAS